MGWFFVGILLEGRQLNKIVSILPFPSLPKKTHTGFATNPEYIRHVVNLMKLCRKGEGGGKGRGRGREREGEGERTLYPFWRFILGI